MGHGVRDTAVRDTPVRDTDVGDTAVKDTCGEQAEGGSRIWDVLPHHSPLEHCTGVC